MEEARKSDLHFHSSSLSTIIWSSYDATGSTEARYISISRIAQPRALACSPFSTQSSKILRACAMNAGSWDGIDPVDAAKAGTGSAFDVDAKVDGESDWGWGWG